MNPQDFEAFRTDAQTRGFDDVLVREWAPGLVTGTHEHPFDVDARVVRGEFWLAVDGQTRHLQAGDAFTLARGLPHAEQYGPEGATFWVARRNAPAGLA